MSVVVVCECKSRFELKDEFAGTLVECPSCGRTMTAGDASVATAVEDPIFGRDLYLLAQKVLRINESYVVADESGHPLLFVERPAHLLRGMLALVVGFVAAMMALVVMLIVIGPFMPELQENETSTVASVLSLLMMFVGIAVFVIVMMAAGKKRHVSFHGGTNQSSPRVIEVLQDKKVQFPTRTFTVLDGSGEPIGMLSKNFLHSILRKHWTIRDGRGRPVATVREDSIILSLIRRVGAFVPLLRFMRTNFLFFKFGSDRELGEFRRKRTILDKYVLDLTTDPTRILDRRLAVAMAVMLDTAERR